MLVNMEGKIIGIDYGSKRVGIAVSDNSQKFAFAKSILTNNDILLDAIANLAESEGAVFFVIGESDNPSGGENTIMRRINIFKRALEVRTGLPVFEISEAYSSAEARRALETNTKSRKEKKTAIDAAAAAIILQTFLDSNHQKVNNKKNI